MKTIHPLKMRILNTQELMIQVKTTCCPNPGMGTWTFAIKSSGFVKNGIVEKTTSNRIVLHGIH